jgi:CPA2 family monovalent cation:H+ antiporter-2
VPTGTTLTDHTILVGYGRVGRIVGTALKRKDEPFVVIEASDARIAELC